MQSFSYGVQPHGNAAAAARHFDRLVRGDLRGRTPTPAEARAIVTARRAYVRCCVGYARRLREDKGMIFGTNLVKQMVNGAPQFPASRPRERRSEPARAVIGRDDGEDVGAESELPPRLMCSLCGQRAESVHILPGMWNPKVIRFACHRHDPRGYWFRLHDWHTGPPDWHRPGAYTMRRHLLTTKTHGRAAVALIERAMHAQARTAA